MPTPFLSSSSFRCQCTAYFTCCLVVFLAIGASQTIAEEVDLSKLDWQKCATCPESPVVSSSASKVTFGNASSSEDGSQNRAFHFVSAELPPAGGYSVTFNYNLKTWDSYNAPGTPNPPFNGGTGFYDSFSISVSSSPIWNLTLSDPLTTSQLPGLAFLWGGASYGDTAADTVSGTSKTVVVKGNPSGKNYLNVGLDTSLLPESDNAFPSSGSITITKIESNGCGEKSIPVPLSKQCNSSWNSDPYDHTSSTMCALGCATSSVAMVLSSYGINTSPKQYNDWLKNYYHDANGNGVYDTGDKPYGYTSGGDIIWTAVAAYSKNKVTYKGWGGGTQSDLDTELCANRPAILRVPGHFVVAKGKPSTGGLAQYTINDPGYSKTTLAQYSSSFNSMRRFGPPGSGSITFYLPSAADILITDPLGRRIGVENGPLLNEIIGASYEEETIDSVETGQQVIVSKVVHIPDPSQGYYSIRVSSESLDQVAVQVYRVTREEKPQTKLDFLFNLVDANPAVGEIPYSTKLGDLNGDGFVDELDIQIILDSLGSSQGGAGYNPVADTDFNEEIDFADYKMVVDQISGADFDLDGVLDSEDACLNSITNDFIEIEACQTDIVNEIQSDGCSRADFIKKCELDLRNHGSFTKCTAKLFDQWLSDASITRIEKDTLQSCSAKSTIGKKNKKKK